MDSTSNIYVASDHAGKSVKEEVMRYVDAVDLSPENTPDDDYPDFAERVAKKVKEEKDSVGVLACGTGFGMSIAANRHEGVRAAVITSVEEAKKARAHNHANVLVLPGDYSGTEDDVESILEAFLSTAYLDGRHARRVKKLDRSR